MPDPGSGLAVDADNKPLDTAAHFHGGVSIDSGPFVVQADRPGGFSVFFRGLITTDPAHVGQSGEILAIGHVAYADGTQGFYTLDNTAKVVLWADQQPASLQASRPPGPLARKQQVNIYTSYFSADITAVRVWFGYRLTESGEIVFNAKALATSNNPERARRNRSVGLCLLSHLAGAGTES